jgi:hypothetical protein
MTKLEELKADAYAAWDAAWAAAYADKDAVYAAGCNAAASAAWDAYRAELKKSEENN